MTAANANGWAIARGGTEGPAASANILIRVKAAASDYAGRIPAAPCFSDAPGNAELPWTDVPVQDSSPWVVTGKNFGTAAPQGVTCRAVADLVVGDCLARLKAHISDTGGSYFASS